MPPTTGADTGLTDVANVEAGPHGAKGAAASSASIAESVVATLSYDFDEGKRLSPPKLAPLTITPDLAAAFARAVVVNRGDASSLSFTSLLVGMMTGSDDIGKWMNAHLEKQGASARRIAERQARSFDEAALRGITWQSAVIGTELSTSISARRALEEGQRIASELDGTTTLDVKHVAAAYPVLSDWHDQDFRDLGIDRLAWTRAFGAHLAKTLPEEKHYWRDYADRASPVPLTSFSADVYTERDLLGIDRSVDALALLIASTRTDTPLAIGVFGPWGSGKSFFMRHLRRRIWSLAERERKRVGAWIEKRKARTARAADAPLYYDQVAQVEFNAWHYNEGNIVASLVDHLFRNLRVLPGEKDRELESRRVAVALAVSDAKVQLTQASQAVALTERDVAVARAAVDRASEEAASARVEVDSKSKDLDDTSARADAERRRIESAIRGLTAESQLLDPAAVLAVAARPLTGSLVAAEAKSALETFRRETESWRTFLSRLLSARGVVVIALCLVAPVVAWLADWLTSKWAALAGVVTAGAASLGHVRAFVREQRQQLESKLAELEREEAAARDRRRVELEREQADVQEQWSTKLATLQTALDEGRAALARQEEAVAAAVRALAERAKQLDAKTQARASAEKRLAEAQTQLKQLSSALLLDEFIRDRSSTDEYRKQLGFLALVRRDFERLSDLIAAANAEWCDPAAEAPAPLLNRIVLYIDDLDRCKVDTVLKVLEVVHLLLAFPLFVCVVAVDPRWIEECLTQTHSTLFGERGPDQPARVTVGDYLEKIFQIPIWMKPIEDRQRATIVKALLGKTAAPELRTPASSAHQEARSPGVGEDLVGEPGAGADGFAAAVERAEEMQDPLQITQAESQFMDRVAALLSDKPRALKRFVNTYRLLKASLPDVDRAAFVSEQIASPHRICISQLALFTGQPRIAPLLVHQLMKTDDTSLALLPWVEALPQDVRAALEGLVGKLPDASSTLVTDFRSWLPDTSKYLFHREG